ncbi:ferric iron uptake transcriptional regulator [Permianibacter aggregans]|uniref:ferric iron uptake transcriptional regulator n=1 Tax=Permianibacter aggregans TaxID=1510150 RepID=UPI0010616654|nr:ferric iron uptake transcriptional regulator [Permianibacter aggregans]QGX40230.1 ferric iron uptake transcriptional regulator [Permianibacter aggregans]
MVFRRTLSVDNSQLRNAGLKVTLPRMKILQILEQAPNRHMSAEDVYKMLMEQGDDVGLATVYRVLTQFEQAGLVLRHHFEGGHSVFELDEQGHHDHLVCLRCNKVVEFVDEVIEQRQKAVAEKHKMTLTDHSLYLYGICEKCSKS